MVLHALIFLAECLARKRISKFLFLLIGIFYIYNSRNALTGTVQLLGYISFFASFKVYFFIYFVLVIHIFGLFGLSIGLDSRGEFFNLSGIVAHAVK